MNQEELDEYFDYEIVLNRMLDKIPSTMDKREGSIIYDALSPAAAEIAQMYLVLKNNIDLVFVDTAVGEYLDRLANQIGLTRKEATSSIRRAEFYNEEDVLVDINIGARFTINDLTFKTTERIETGIYKCECETLGIIGNSVSGSLMPVDYIQGLGKAILTDILIPGEDSESDEDLRQRYFETINERTFAGNIADYKKKTKEIQGVGLVKVIPAWAGGGTVKLTIMDSDYNKASAELIENVQEIICPDMSSAGIGLAPIGHIVTVDTTEEVKIDISTVITLASNSELETVKSMIITEIKKYLLELRKTWEDEENLVVRISQIESRILNIESVLDISETKINTGTSNIELASNQIPIIGEVEVTV